MASLSESSVGVHGLREVNIDVLQSQLQRDKPCKVGNEQTFWDPHDWDSATALQQHVLAWLQEVDDEVPELESAVRQCERRCSQDAPDVEQGDSGQYLD
jgi:hypothetical protein